MLTSEERRGERSGAREGDEAFTKRGSELPSWKLPACLHVPRVCVLGTAPRGDPRELHRVSSAS